MTKKFWLFRMGKGFQLREQCCGKSLRAVFTRKVTDSADNVVTLAHSILKAMAETPDSFIVDFDVPPELKKARPDLYKPLEPAEIAKVKERIGFALST